MAAKFTKELTELLNKLGDETHTMDNDGVMVTRNESLIRLLWDTALGYTEEVEIESGKDKGERKMIKHKPQKWAMELIYNRKEGGLAATSDSNEGGISAAATVRELTKARINRLARKAAGAVEETDDSE
jgi:hypothetical protein